LVEHPGFISFYSQVTPIDVLEQSNIGSRPARRTGRRSLADLRAIPWVFSWNQARFGLTGWYGVGEALQSCAEEYPRDWQILADLAQNWPFMRYTLIQIETNLLLAEPELMRAYADLAEDQKIAATILGLVLEDYQKAQKGIAELLGGSIEERRLSRLEGIRMREQGLLWLHALQIRYLKEWRGLSDRGTAAGQELLTVLLATINSISSGLKNTG
jgi:phosphoenolpyruvate carboxylase